MTEAAPRSTCSRQSHVISDKRPVPGGTDATEVTGILYGAKLLEFAGYPTAEVLGPDASEEDIETLIEKHGSVFVKPVFKGVVGKKGKAGLIGRAFDLKTALKEKERLYLSSTALATPSPRRTA